MAKSEMSEWIPVTERVPEVCEDVLICDRRGHIDFGFLYSKDGSRRWWENSDLDVIEENDAKKGITAWMPLPKPYKEHSGREQGHHRGIAGGDRPMRNENGTAAAETLLVIIAVVTLAVMIVR